MNRRLRSRTIGTRTCTDGRRRFLRDAGVQYREEKVTRLEKGAPPREEELHMREVGVYPRDAPLPQSDTRPYRREAEVGRCKSLATRSGDGAVRMDCEPVQRREGAPFVREPVSVTRLLMDTVSSAPGYRVVSMMMAYLYVNEGGAVRRFAAERPGRRSPPSVTRLRGVPIPIRCRRIREHAQWAIAGKCRCCSALCDASIVRPAAHAASLARQKRGDAGWGWIMQTGEDPLA